VSIHVGAVPSRPEIHSSAVPHRRHFLRPVQAPKSNPRWARIPPPPFPSQEQPSHSRILDFPVTGRGQGLRCKVWGLFRGWNAKPGDLFVRNQFSDLGCPGWTFEKSLKS
jgi:hypothetical protein